MMYFKNIETLEELKKAYRELALKHHPDRGGNVETMQAINNEYETLFAKVKDIHKNKAGETFTKASQEAPNEFINIINELLKMDGVNFEVIGCFIWVSGNTKPHKETLKNMGFKWHRTKACWYLAPADYRKCNNTEYSMDDIRRMYGTRYKGTGTNKEDEPKIKVIPERKQIQWAF